MLTTDYEYSRRNRENVPLLIQRIVSKIEFFFWYCIQILDCTLNLKHFKTNMEPHSSNSCEVIDSGKCAYLTASKVLFLTTFP